jgi:hypothetical protein
MRPSILGEIKNTAKATNAEWFSADIVLQFNALLLIDISYTDAEDVEITFDSGTTWHNLLTTTANTLHHLEVVGKNGDQVNFRTTSVTPPNIDLARVAIAD